ncbi:MAG: alpha/beta hydrolase, partial [Bacteroidaceae bacterium]|nr:alpha/beta hydrolase [Bacteroidaceae bacterium]
MKITFRKTIYACAVLLAIILFSLGAGSCYMLSYSLGEDPNRKDVDSAYNVLYRRVPDMRCWVDSLKQNGLLRDTFITMPSGERHHAIYLRADSAQGRTAIVVHGYRDTAPKYLYLGRMYHRDLGFNILMPDLHAHGLSDGEGIGMGWNERHDVIRWAEVAE